METETPAVRFKDDLGNDFPSWETVPLGEIADIKLGKMLDKEKHTSGHLLPYLNNISLRWNDVDTSNLPQMYFKDSELERFGLKTGDVIVCEGGEPGRSAIWDGRLPNLKFQKAIHRVRFSVPYKAALLVLYLQRIVGSNRFEMLFTGGGIKHLTRETFAKLKVPKPSLPEQQKIADFLTAVDRRVGQLIQKKALLEDYKKGVMQQLFTQAIRFKDDHGNDFPDWQEKKLGEVLEIKSGLSLDQNGNAAGFKVTRIETISDRTVNLDKVGYVETEKDIEDFRLLPGDILFSNINSVSHIGKVAFVDRDYDLYQGMNLLRLRPNPESDPKFVFQLLSSVPFIRYFQRICNQAVSQASINQTDLKNTPLKAPSPNEQTKIANFLSAIDRKIESVATQITETQTFKRGLLQQMFV